MDRASSQCLAVVLLGVAVSCGPHPEPGDQRGLELRFDSDPASDSFGTVLLGPLWDEDKLSLDGREALEELDHSERFLWVWTGEPRLSPGSCDHPTHQQAILGTIRIHDTALQFKPRLPFSQGLTYTACGQLEPPTLTGFGLKEVHGALTLVFRIPEARDVLPPRVVAISPSVTEVPGNLLRLYIEFSEPMNPEGIADHITLIDDFDEILPESFVAIPDGLWDPGRSRLTLFLHPGRIKRGVIEDPVLIPGQTVQVRVSAGVKSLRGVSLEETFSRAFLVVEADRSSPRPDDWELVQPANERSPLVLHFDESLDNAQLLHCARVLDSNDQIVSGDVEIGSLGRSWIFTPTNHWSAGRYRLLVDPDIEDLAGNTTRRLFDVETGDSAAANSQTPIAPTRFGEAESIGFTFVVEP